MLSASKYLGLLAVSGSLLFAAPATATVTGPAEKFHDEYTDDFEFCGLSVHVDGVVDGNLLTRVGRGDEEEAFFGHANYAYNEVLTNTANGKYVLGSGRATFQETKATHIEGTIFEFTAVEAGQPFVVRAADGSLILRDRGAIRSTILFDTLGDDTPGGEFLGLVSEHVAGPHPGFDDATRCEAVLPYLT